MAADRPVRSLILTVSLEAADLDALKAFFSALLFPRWNSASYCREANSELANILFTIIYRAHPT